MSSISTTTTFGEPGRGLHRPDRPGRGVDVERECAAVGCVVRALVSHRSGLLSVVVGVSIVRLPEIRRTRRRRRDCDPIARSRRAPRVDEACSVSRSPAPDAHHGDGPPGDVEHGRGHAPRRGLELAAAHGVPALPGQRQLLLERGERGDRGGGVLGQRARRGAGGAASRRPRARRRRAAPCRSRWRAWRPPGRASPPRRRRRPSPPRRRSARRRAATASAAVSPRLAASRCSTTRAERASEAPPAWPARSIRPKPRE